LGHKALGWVSIGLLLGGILFGQLPGYAQYEGVFVGPKSSRLYPKVAEIEAQVYGKSYPDQSIAQRIARLEHTLFGVRQLGNLESRYQGILAKVSGSNNQADTLNKGPLVDYLEQKLFTQTYAQMPMNLRLRNLEAHVFGKTFDEYPPDMRLKKLSYTLPLITKGIKLSSEGVVVASTALETQRQATTTAKQAPINSPISVASQGRQMVTKRQTPDGTPISLGDYFLNVHRASADKTLRWDHLPVNVYVRKGTPEDMVLVQKALATWNQAFRFELLERPRQADIVIDFMTPNSTDIITRPVLQLDDGREVRSVVQINMSSFSSWPSAPRLGALIHQLGHAAGIWGHSDDPNDRMYPSAPSLVHDIPPQWLRRSPFPNENDFPSEPFSAFENNPSVTQRDMNTLIRIYATPSADLRRYSPYQ